MTEAAPSTRPINHLKARTMKHTTLGSRSPRARLTTTRVRRTSAPEGPVLSMPTDSDGGEAGSSPELREPTCRAWRNQVRLTHFVLLEVALVLALAALTFFGVSRLDNSIASRQLLATQVQAERDTRAANLQFVRSTLISGSKLKPFAGLDLQGAQLATLPLSGADLRGADLRSAGLGGADLRRVDLRGANLSGAEMGAADLRGVDLHKTDLSGANLRGADLRETDLSVANLQAADLSFANLSRAGLGAANLSSAGLGGANLRGADLRGAYLNDAAVDGADLRGADLRDATVTERQLISATADASTRLPEALGG